MIVEYNAIIITEGRRALAFARSLRLSSGEYGDASACAARPPASPAPVKTSALRRRCPRRRAKCSTHWGGSQGPSLLSSLLPSFIIFPPRQSQLLPCGLRSPQMRTVSIHALNLTHSVQCSGGAMGLAACLPACLPASVPSRSLSPSFTAGCVHATTYYARRRSLARSLRDAAARVLAPDNGGGRRVRCFPPSLARRLKAILLRAKDERDGRFILISHLIRKVHCGVGTVLLSLGPLSNSSSDMYSGSVALQCTALHILHLRPRRGRECNGAQLVLFTPHEARLASPCLPS